MLHIRWFTELTVCSKILSRLVQDRLQTAKDITQDPESPINFTELSTQTEGYSATDLKDLVARAIHEVAMRAHVERSSNVIAASLGYMPTLTNVLV